MPPRTSQIILPKDIYLDFIRKMASSSPGYAITKVKGRRIVMPYELRDAEGKVVLNYDRWFNSVSTYFAEARLRIIHGERLSIWPLGFIHGKRIERNYRNKRVNWKATLATGVRFDEEKQKNVPNRKIYYTDPDYCRIGWTCNHFISAAVKPYKFQPTNSSKNRLGFKQQFSTMLEENQALKLKFLYYPYYPYIA